MNVFYASKKFPFAMLTYFTELFLFLALLDFFYVAQRRRRKRPNTTTTIILQVYHKCGRHHIMHHGHVNILTEISLANFVRLLGTSGGFGAFRQRFAFGTASKTSIFETSKEPQKLASNVTSADFFGHGFIFCTYILLEVQN